MANGPRSIRRSLFATRCSLLAQSQFCFVQTAEDRGRIALLSSVLCPPLFAGLVALARRKDPIPSRTRPSNALAPMVLCLKTWESRSSPGLQRTELPLYQCRRRNSRRRIVFDAGWSSPVARQAHNLKAAGSNPAPATSVHGKNPRLIG